MDTLAFIVGSGFTSTLIFFPIAYLALKGQFKFRFPNLRIVGLFILCFPIVGSAQAMLGRGDTDTFGGWFVLFGIPLLICLAIIFGAYRLSTKPTGSTG